MLHSRILVIGTTADYIDIIHRRFGDRVLFITDRAERERATESALPGESELLCDLSRLNAATSQVRDHLNSSQIRPTGVACFDCESMMLASLIATDLGLSFPAPGSIAAFRNKYKSKSIWKKNGIPCPACSLVRSESEASDVLRKSGRPIVLKPLTGSGSEFVSLCRSESECSAAFRNMAAGVRSHHNVRMYAAGPDRFESCDPRKEFAAEEFVQGEEYSCDFVIDRESVEVVRVARKIRPAYMPFGTTTAYLLPASLPPEVSHAEFRDILVRAAQSIGIDRAICMLDFMIVGGQVSLIELTPRPGGDCLPPLMLRSSGFDILGYALDFAEGVRKPIPPPSQWKQLVGLRIIATAPCTIRSLDSSGPLRDSRVLECDFRQKPGARIDTSGASYDSRILGHIIFQPDADSEIEPQCAEIESLLRLELEYDR